MFASKLEENTRLLKENNKNLEEIKDKLGKQLQTYASITERGKHVILENSKKIDILEEIVEKQNSEAKNSFETEGGVLGFNK